MGYKIKELLLEGGSLEKYVIENGSARMLTPLTKVNMFVGANNSGKSRFIREIAKTPKLRFAPPNDLVSYNALLGHVKDEVQKAIKLVNATDINNYAQNLNQVPRLEIITEGEDYAQPLKACLTLMKQTNQLNIQSQYYSGANQNPQIIVAFQKLASDSLVELARITDGIDASINFKRVYVPTLRSLRYLHGTDILLSSTKANYFKDSDQVEVFTGQQLYDELQKLLLGTLEQRQSMVRFQDFLSETFFESKPVALIPKYKENHIFVKIGDERERAVYELGDGIQSIIILTFPIFQYRKQRLLLFIEEPELFLHPAMQRVFVNALLRSEFINAQCFIATHSNHLLDLTLDISEISVFTFQKELDLSESDERDAKTTIQNVSNESSSSLELLGIQNSSVFLSNCTIWVEGITDRRYLLHYLRLYSTHLDKSGDVPLKQYKQDLHYSFVEYSGSNITHWSFLDDTPDPIVVDRLCGRLFLIADQDMAKGAKENRAAKLKTKLGSRYYVLACREIENLVAPMILRDVVQEYEGDGTQVELPKYEDYKTEYLGTFIEKTLLKAKKRRAGKYASDSGTITGKTDFCQKVIDHSRTFEDLSKEAKELTKKLYNFIKDHNP